MTFKLTARSFATVALVLACNANTAIASNATPKSVFPMTQGIHEWAVPKGKLSLIVGTYQDVIKFQRTYNLYFIAKDDDTWNHVPFLRKGDMVDLSMSSASGGDVTLTDGLAFTQGNNFYFVVADKHGDKGWVEQADITVTWFKFIDSADSESDTPAYVLKPIFTRTYAKSTNPNIENILNKEFLLKPLK